MIGLIKNLKNKYTQQIQHLCCDNEGKNIAFEKACKQEGVWVDFKYTTPGILQQNGCIEQKFATLFDWVCAMFNGSKFNAYLQNSLLAKAANTAMLLENNLLTPNRTLSPFQQLFRKGKRRILTLMQKFGEMCIISSPTGITHTGLN